jgi:hypothetical protein
MRDQSCTALGRITRAPGIWHDILHRLHAGGIACPSTHARPETAAGDAHVDTTPEAAVRRAIFLHKTWHASSPQASRVTHLSVAATNKNERLRYAIGLDFLPGTHASVLLTAHITVENAPRADDLPGSPRTGILQVWDLSSRPIVAEEKRKTGHDEQPLGRTAESVESNVPDDSVARVMSTLRLASRSAPVLDTASGADGRSFRLSIAERAPDTLYVCFAHNASYSDASLIGVSTR